jgi:hypothetical protein
MTVTEALGSVMDTTGEQQVPPLPPFFQEGHAPIGITILRTNFQIPLSLLTFGVCLLRRPFLLPALPRHARAERSRYG